MIESLVGAFVYPRYAAFGDGYSKWEIVILLGKRKAEQIFAINLKEARRIREKVRTDQKIDPESIPTDNESAYQYAKRLVLAELKRLEKEEPLV